MKGDKDMFLLIYKAIVVVKKYKNFLNLLWLSNFCKLA